MKDGDYCLDDNGDSVLEYLGGQGNLAKSQSFLLGKKKTFVLC